MPNYEKWICFVQLHIKVYKRDSSVLLPSTLYPCFLSLNEKTLPTSHFLMLWDHFYRWSSARVHFHEFTSHFGVCMCAHADHCHSDIAHRMWANSDTEAAFFVTQWVSQRLPDTSDMEISGQRHVEALIPHQNPHRRGKWMLYSWVFLSVINFQSVRLSISVSVGGDWAKYVLGIGNQPRRFRQLCDIFGRRGRSFLCVGGCDAALPSPQLWSARKRRRTCFNFHLLHPETTLYMVGFTSSLKAKLVSFHSAMLCYILLSTE